MLTDAQMKEVLAQIHRGIQRFYLESSEVEAGSSALKPTQDLNAMLSMASMTLRQTEEKPS